MNLIMLQEAAQEAQGFCTAHTVNYTFQLHSSIVMLDRPNLIKGTARLIRIVATLKWAGFQLYACKHITDASPTLLVEQTHIFHQFVWVRYISSMV